MQRTQRSRKSDGFPSAMRALGREERLLHPKKVAEGRSLIIILHSPE